MLSSTLGNHKTDNPRRYFLQLDDFMRAAVKNDKPFYSTS